MSCKRHHSPSESELIKSTKSAINARKYAYPNEITLLWGRFSKTSWLQIILIACVGSFLLMLLTS